MGKIVSLRDNFNNILELNCDTVFTGSEGDMMHTFQCEMNVTGNYSDLLKESLGSKGLYELDGKTGDEVSTKLAVAVLMLGTKQSDDYWEPTEGNVGFCLNELLTWANELPKGVFKVLG
ncbi:MAG: hypothetical protein EHM73_14530 [Chroococcales cyanobacterium metabat2.561]|nr:MAG: hypothetical protein EHM73_14530 [Chroococcales cyanobacterium metabat2.561]